jgi:hypothetical protein
VPSNEFRERRGDGGRDRLEEHDHWENAHSAMRHELVDREFAPHWVANERRFMDVEARVYGLERRGDRFDAVIGTLRVQFIVLGTLITAFGGAILWKLGVI